jgi:O-antigen/teichoic acid export membrane protein
MRTRAAKKNILIALLSNALIITIGLFAQRIFVNTLGVKYLGINGLISNLVAMLGIAELGLGSAIYYQLYKPMHNNDHEKVKSLVGFYKKTYRLVALVIGIIGIISSAFVYRYVGSQNINENIVLIYYLFLLDAILSYYLIYKRSLLYADQKQYLIDIIHVIYMIALNLCQIAILILTNNFYLYLGIKIVMRIVENLILSLLTAKKYPYITEKNVKKLDLVTRNNIVKSIKGLSFHKFASYAVLNTDNIVIAFFLGISAVGLYSNYYLVIAALVLVFGQTANAVTSSVGNMMVQSSKRALIVYQRINFAVYCLSVFVTSLFFILMQGFVALWLGKQFLLSEVVLVVLTINLYLTLMRAPIMSFKDATGIFHEDRYMPVIEAFINLIFSIIFVKFFGLSGVFLGTMLSILFLHLYSYPKYVYKVLFKKRSMKYYQTFFTQLLATALIVSINYILSININSKYALLTLLLKSISCITVTGLILTATFYKSSEFKYFRQSILHGLRSSGKLKITK